MSALFTLETPQFRLVWSGPSGDVLARDGLTVSAVQDAVYVTDTQGVIHAVDTVWTGDLGITEETSYTVWLQSRTGERVTLRHRDPLLTRRLVANDQGRVLHGVVRFGATAGQSPFEVLIAGRIAAAFSVQVAPTKMAWADVQAMQHDIDSVLEGLAIAFLGATTQDGLAERRERGGRPVWLHHLRQAMPALEQALQAIRRRPRTGLVLVEEHVRASRVRRPGSETRRAVARRQGRGVFVSHDVPVREHVPSLVTTATFDTPEHRWLRARLEAVHRRLGSIRREEASMQGGPRRDAIRSELDGLAASIRRMLHQTPLAEASSSRPGGAMPMAMRRVSAYVEAARTLRRLDLGLVVAEGASATDTRSLSELYEMWCYLTVGQRMAACLGTTLSPSTFFRMEARGVRLRLKQGQAHALVFRDKERYVRLVYQPRFGADPGLLPQRPDLLLVVRPNEGPERLFVLDAKYRRDDSDVYKQRHGAAGPPREALGDLHRYRDAIVVAEPGQRAVRPVEAALALYPYRPDPEADFTESRLWTSIRTIGIGAIPCLPGATDLLDRWLAEVLR